MPGLSLQQGKPRPSAENFLIGNLSPLVCAASTSMVKLDILIGIRIFEKVENEMVQNHIQINKRYWDEVTDWHTKADAYDVEGFKRMYQSGTLLYGAG